MNVRYFLEKALDFKLTDKQQNLFKEVKTTVYFQGIEITKEDLDAGITDIINPTFSQHHTNITGITSPTFDDPSSSDKA